MEQWKKDFLFYPYVSLSHFEAALLFALVSPPSRGGWVTKKTDRERVRYGLYFVSAPLFVAFLFGIGLAHALSVIG